MSSGFRNLELVEPAIVKIDMSYLHLARNDLKGAGRLKSLVDFCKFSNALCVIEGVETKQDFKVAKELGADFVQGFYLDFNLTSILSTS